MFRERARVCAEKQSEGVRRCVPATHKRQSAPERGEGGWVESAWGREGERKRDETKKREEKKESKKEKKKEREKERKKKREKKITRERKSERERAREDERTSERERARERERGTERATEREGARESERERARGSTRGRERERERRVLHILKHVNKCFNAVKTFAHEARAAEKARHALSDNTYTATSIHVYQCCCTHTHTSKSNMLVTAASPEAILFSSLCQSRALPRALTQHFMRTVPHKSNATLDPHTSASATCHRIWNQKARPCVKEAFCCGARRTLRH